MTPVLDPSNYEKDLRGHAKEHASGRRARPLLVESEVVSRVEKILGKEAPRRGSTQYVREVGKALNAIMDRLIKEGGQHDQIMAIMHLEDDLFNVGKDPDAEAQEIIEAYEKVLSESLQIGNVFLATVKAAVGRVEAWGDSPVRVEISTRYDSMLGDADYTEPSDSFHVIVGKEDAGFTVFTDKGKNPTLGDILEGGDEDFFSDVQEQADYFNLVKELQSPGSSSRGKNVTLWTARPTKDRARYEGAHTVPPNIFLTNDPDRAYGLAQEGELGGQRDVWRVVMSEAHLVVTLDRGTMRDYQVVGKGPVPVKSLSLVAPSTPQGRVAARYLAQGAYYFNSQFAIGDPRSGSTPIALYGREVQRKFLEELPTRGFALPEYNYIYKVTEPLIFFDGGEEDCLRLVQSGIVDLSRFKELFMGSTDPVEIARVLSLWSRKYSHSPPLANPRVDRKVLYNLWDGEKIGTRTVAYPTPNFMAKCELVDGSVFRTDSGPKEENRGKADEALETFSYERNLFPKSQLGVEKELARYKDTANTKMNIEVKKWLLEHSPKPYASKRIYRGFTVPTSFSYAPDWFTLTVDAAEKLLYKYTGLRHIDQIRVGAHIVVKRGKESSWSTSPMVAANSSTNGGVTEDMNFLVKTDIPASQVVIDFTELPADMRSQFQYPGQAEVIVDIGAIPCTISRFFIHPKFNKWLDQNGYEYVAQKGIYRKE